MINKVIILDNHLQGLGVSRICHGLGLEVHLYNHSAVCVARHSNTCSHFTVYKGEADLLAKLLGFNSPEKNTILIPTNDRMVGFINANYDVLFQKFYLSLPGPEVIDIGYNKIKTYKLCQDLGIPIPESYFPENISDLEKISNDLNYPVILKPAVMHSFYSTFGVKVFKCNNKQELIESYKKTTEHIPPKEVIIQEFLTGGAPSLYSFGSFCSGDKVWGGFSANRLRQKPMDFGISTTYAKTVNIPILKEYATKFLVSMKYFGLSEVEFMYDDKSNSYKLLEINPRTWKWHTITNRLGINLIGQMVDYLNKKEIKEDFSTLENIAWVERLTDTFVVLKEIMKGQMRWKDYRKTMKLRKESAAYSKKDILPALMYILYSPYFFFKR
jgi:predicted ATP-grasp superfamily ATP-dependent carboligase